MNSQKETLEIIERGAAEILIHEELVERLKSKRPLRVKAGFDPTAPDLHLGHTVLINKMRQFQDLGHQVIFLIGDFTGLIGDPTGKNTTRPPMTPEEVAENAKTYKEQIFKILDPDLTEVRFNSEWMEKFTPAQMIQLAARHTVARMLERDDFQKRYSGGQPIAIHELLYPLVQGYDSIALQADVELGGTDQTFNLLVGRELQKQYGQPSQIVLTMPLLEGLDGVQKMSKSVGNYVGITEVADEMFGKLMSISDQLMWRYFELLSFRPLHEVEKFRVEIKEGLNPRDVKFLLAEEVIARFHNQAAATRARENFISRFQKGQLPDNLPEVSVTAGEGIALANLLKEAGLVGSTSDAHRMVKQGAVRIDGERIADSRQLMASSQVLIIQVGKRRFAKVTTLK
ncbi:MAG: tyrosine--tRNA ligase [Acidiferrobacteraceae bacterium]|jgi:tyrosyl-tRNA synthetase|nr:tyrosine--tRNA ligase [Acidiferrobacteraceae bacterium]MDP6123742.1 tyrosine--tRNA ligase [Arenicellales bacterium]MDP6435378.1 tyrosine--tRNA ligase [Arenicellales bacterium]MDP6672106.1 tyrosine--tRNA ligase [Arenicellales bacterium]MDP6724962.1 tyrosine--tRNA ligase [Arenicellales bacterium]|tara:strand:+ start:48210 stop:49409 length:1200 start_codon:yes stop_codon:yes gene_type:complete